MGCGESKHAVATENATIPNNKRSLSSKSDSAENGVAEMVNDEKVEASAAKVEEKEEKLIAPKVVAVEKEKAKEMVELEKATEDVVVENKEEKVVEPKNTNDGITPVSVVEKKNETAPVSVVAVVEKKESVEEIKAEEKTEETIKPIEEEKEKEKEKEKEEVSSASEATDAAKPETAKDADKPETVKDADKPETQEKPKEENATETSATTDSKTD